jgi:hypothetical protein
MKYRDNDLRIQELTIVKSRRRGSQSGSLADSQDMSEYQNFVKIEKQMVSNIRQLHTETLEILRNRRRDDEVSWDKAH